VRSLRKTGQILRRKRKRSAVHRLLYRVVQAA
jgi:hypothetical protein